MFFFTISYSNQGGAPSPSNTSPKDLDVSVGFCPRAEPDAKLRYRHDFLREEPRESLYPEKPAAACIEGI